MPAQKVQLYSANNSLAISVATTVPVTTVPVTTVPVYVTIIIVDYL